MRQFPRLLRIVHDGCAFCPTLYAFHLRVPALAEYYNGISFIRVFSNYVVYALYEGACGVNSIKPQFAALFYLLWRYAMGAYYDIASGRYLLERLGGYYPLCAKLIYDSKVMYELAVGVYGTAVLHLFTGYLYSPLHAEAEAYVLCRDDFHCISSSRALSPSKAAVSRFVNSSDISLRLRFSRPSLLTGSPTIIRNRMES